MAWSSAPRDLSSLDKSTCAPVTTMGCPLAMPRSPATLRGPVDQNHGDPFEIARVRSSGDESISFMPHHRSGGTNAPSEGAPAKIARVQSMPFRVEACSSGPGQERPIPVCGSSWGAGPSHSPECRVQGVEGIVKKRSGGQSIGVRLGIQIPTSTVSNWDNSTAEIWEIRSCGRFTPGSPLGRTSIPDQDLVPLPRLPPFRGRGDGLVEQRSEPPHLLSFRRRSD